MRTAKSLVMKPLFKMKVEKDKTKYDRKSVITENDIKEVLYDCDIVVSNLVNRSDGFSVDIEADGVKQTYNVSMLSSIPYKV